MTSGCLETPAAGRLKFYHADSARAEFSVCGFESIVAFCRLAAITLSGIQCPNDFLDGDVIPRSTCPDGRHCLMNPACLKEPHCKRRVNHGKS